MQLEEELTLIQYGIQLISDYLHTIKALADEITIINHPIFYNDLTLYSLIRLGPIFS